jgi:TolB protein
MTHARQSLLSCRLIIAGALALAIGAGAAVHAAAGMPAAPRAAPVVGSGLIAFVGRLGSRAASADLFLLRWDGARSTVARLTEGFGRVYGLSWSPDGGKLVFAGQQAGSAATGLYVADLRAGRIARLTDQFGARQGVAYPPQWSPDGSRVLYASDHPGNSDIFVIQADGSGLINLTRHSGEDSQPRWSPDGKTVYFRSIRDGRKGDDLYAVSAAGGESRRLAEMGGGTLGGLAVSPDGKRLAFHYRNDIHVIGVDGSGLANLTGDAKANYDPAWSPDGARIAFRSERSGERDKSSKRMNIDLYVMTAPGASSASAPRINRLTTDSETDQMHAWSPDGAALVFTSRQHGLSQLYWVRADGAGLARLTEREDWEDIWPAWQPAGAAPVALPEEPIRFSAAAAAAAVAAPTPDPPPAGRIVFSSDRDGNFEIYTAGQDGGRVARLTSHPAFDGEPAWSPDGARIVFSSHRDGDSNLYRMNADGSQLARLTDHAAMDATPAWSPDGKWIVFTSNRGGDFDIYAMQSSGSPATAVITGPGNQIAPAWSPDGTGLVYASDHSGALELYVADSAGIGRPLTRGMSKVASPDWSPNGRYIAFASNAKGNYDLYLVKPDGSGLQQVTRDKADNFQPRWSPDGKFLVFVTGRGREADIYVLAESGSAARVTNNKAADTAPDWGPMK